jgi:hypothetical protein
VSIIPENVFARTHLEKILPQELKNKSVCYTVLYSGSWQEIADLQSIAKQVKKQNKVLLLDNSGEGFVHYIKALYDLLINQEKLKESELYLISGAADIQQEIDKVASDCNKKPFTGIYFNKFEISTADEAFYFKKDLLNDDYCEKMYDFRIKNYEKTFLNFNRRARTHRLATVAMMHSMNLLDHGYVSLTKSDYNYGWQDLYDCVLDEHETHHDSLELLNQFEKYANNFPNLVLDRPLMINNEAHLSNSAEKYYWKSILNLTSETNFYTTEPIGKPMQQPTRFLSEKTFKPILYLQPFILISVPRSLELLRDMGYKTFHPYIDESYDYEEDDRERLLMILRQVEKFVKYTPNQTAEFLHSVKEICFYNKKRIFNTLKN